jgi:hypothetical protein
MTIRTAPEGVAHLIVRRTSNTALRIGIPAQFWRERGLGEGDHCVWTPQPDGTVQLRFVKTHFEEAEIAEGAPM